jgi:hypothetical protein
MDAALFSCCCSGTGSIDLGGVVAVAVDSAVERPALLLWWECTDLSSKLPAAADAMDRA